MEEADNVELAGLNHNNDGSKNDNIIPDNVIVNTIENVNLNSTSYRTEDIDNLVLNQLNKLTADKEPLVDNNSISSIEHEMDIKKRNLSIGIIVDVKMLDSNSFKPGKIKSLVEDSDDKLYNIDFGNNIVENNVHIDRIFLQKHSKIVKNSWDESKDGTLKLLLLKLKFNREVTRFYYYNVCKDEGFWSWALILIATFTSTVTLANNVTEELFPYYFTLIKAMLTLLAAGTTLIAAWMKKQKYVDRINSCDRYLNKIGSVIDNLEMVLIQDPNDRMTYLEFKDKHMNNIKDMVSTPPMSPSEQKYCVFQITVNYPEIISPDNDVDYKLWPWFGIDSCALEKMYITRYGESVIRSFIREQSSICCTFRCAFKCCFKSEKALVDKYYSYFNNDKDIDVSALNPPEKMITFNVGDKVSFIKSEFNKLFHDIKSKVKDKNKHKDITNENTYGIIMGIEIDNNRMFYFVQIKSKLDDIDALINDEEDRIINRYYFKKLKVNNS